MSGSVLFVGDIHLGRRPTRLPDELTRRGLDAPALGPAAAWRRAVERALSEEVDAVVLAGDAVDAENRAFEAFTPLAEGVRRLAAAGVPVWAVAGNHDHDALPHLADAIDGLRLLGRGGTWETVDLRPRGAADAAPFARLVGWSFPRAHVTVSPLADFPGRPGAAGDGLPVLGVLHADLDAADSRYAPVARAELAAAGLDAWLLGHVHAPSPLEGDPPVGYVGSLVGLDPGEPGPRGPVRVDVAPGGGIAVRRLGGAPLRWDEVPVDCGGADVARTGLLGPVVEALDAQRRRVTADDDPDAPETLAIGCRLVLTGRVRDRRALRQALARADLVGFVHPDAAGGPPCFVEHVSDRTRPAVDLEELARSPAPPGLLAERLLALERDDEAGRTLVRRAAESLLRVHEDPAWRDLHASRPTADEVRGLLLTAGRDALDELLAQAGPEGEAGGGAEGGSGRGPEGGAR